MSGNLYQQPQSIRDIVKRIESNDWVLPNIQRKFVWDKERICMLFDSIMQGYPIGTLMIWKVLGKTVNQYKFFTFLRDYQQRFHETCDECKLSGTKDYYAVIDGQQRLNSIYLGLLGSYAEKLPRKWWGSAYDEAIQPKEYLYLNIAQKNEDDEYIFAFMSEDKYGKEEEQWQWFKVGDILNFNYIESDDMDDDFDAEIDRQEILKGKDLIGGEEVFARKTLKRLYKKIFHDRIINYYQEEMQDLDKVVEIFIRTNSGGVPLSFSDLVMAVTVSKWKEARDKIDNLVKLVVSENKLSIDRDFVLKVCLVLFSQDVKFRVKNFDDTLIEQIKKNFEHVSDAIKKTCKFVNQIGISNEVLRAKYALIPIIYFVFITNTDISNPTKQKENRRRIEIWLKLALLKSMFGGQPDSIFPKLREIVRNNAKNGFPTQEIIEQFKNTRKDISIDYDFIYDKVANAQYGSSDAYLLLSLATIMDTQLVYNVDHMYPKSMFAKKELNKLDFLRADRTLYNFYSDPQNWNTVGNLQLLNENENKSKKGKVLALWLADNPTYDKKAYLIPKKESGQYAISIEDFKYFVEQRRILMTKKIMESVMQEAKQEPLLK